MSRYSDRARDVRFYAWCAAADRFDAFAAALSALLCPGAVCDVTLSTLTAFEAVWRHGAHVEEAIALMRANFGTDSNVRASLGAPWPRLAVHGLMLQAWGEEWVRRYPDGPLEVSTVGEWKHIFLDCLEIAARARSVEVEAAISSIEIQQEAEDMLLGLCAPDASGRVPTGAMTCGGWYAPIETGATYHATVTMVARDLALSWLYLHDGNKIDRIAGLPMDVLRERVEAAPQGARVGVAPNVTLVYEHGRLDHASPKPQDERPTDPGILRIGARARLPGDIELTREQVLAALATPPATLLEALEAAAVPDDEWRAVEPLARETIQAAKDGAPTEEVNVSTGKHTRFIEHHAPYHVRRLPNGGVLLATHPYRTLWPLWSDALYLLGILP